MDDEKQNKAAPSEVDGANPEVAAENPPTPEPKPKSKFGDVIKSKKVLIPLVILVALLVAGGVYLFVSSDDEEQSNQQQSTMENQDEDTEVVPEKMITNTEVADFATAEFSMNENGDFLGLTADEKTWIDRSEFDWEKVQKWGDWLFFAEQVSNDWQNNDYSFKIHGFDLKTREYSSSDLITTDGYEGYVGMFVDGDYLYVQIDEYKAEGEVKRCMLDDSTGCTTIEDFYQGSGNVQILDESTALAFDDFGDAGISSRGISRFNPTTGEESDVVSTGSNFGVGTNYEGISTTRLIWITENSGDEDAFELTELSLVKLYAVDLNGEEQKTILPADFPIADPVSQWTAPGVLQDNEVLFVNDTEEVIFNIDSEEFGAVNPVGTTDYQGESDLRTNIERTLDRLGPLDGYELVVTKADEF